MAQKRKGYHLYQKKLTPCGTNYLLTDIHGLQTS